MDKDEAEKLLKDFEYELFWLTKKGGDHPYEDEIHRGNYRRLRERIIKELTDLRMPIG